jgi:hypothetical protein
MKKVSHNGALWCPVSDAARYLRTNAAKVREFMSAGKLAYTQIRRNGQIYVSVSDLVKLQTERVYADKA